MAGSRDYFHNQYIIERPRDDTSVHVCVSVPLQICPCSDVLCSCQPPPAAKNQP